MAILEKRKAVNKLPRFERYQDTRAGNRAAALRGEKPITSAVRQLTGSPAGGAGGAGPVGGAGRPTIDKFGDVSGQPKNAVTSALKGSTAASTTSKAPALTSKTATSTTPAKTLTSTGAKSTGATATKTTGTTAAKTTSKTGSSLGKTISNALTGAALGTGTKFVVDKLTGAKNTGTTKTGTTGTTGTTKTGTTGTTGTTKTGTTGTTGVTSTTKTGNTGVTGTTGTTKAGTGVTSVVKGTGTTGSKSPTVNIGSGSAGPKTPTSTGPKTPVGAGPKTPAGVTSKTAGTAGAVAGAAGTDTAGTDATDTTVTGVAYDDEGNLLPGYELNENGDPVWVGLGDDTTTGGDDSTSGDDTTTETLDDGTVITYDANGDIVSYTDTDGVTYNEDGDVIGDDDDATESTDGLFSDDEGNLYDADGNLVQYADGTMVGDDTDTGNEVAYTDEYGNTYDADGTLIAEGDHSDYVYTAEDGSTYDYDGNLISEADHSDFVQYDDAGNSYDWDGNIISYAEGYGPEDEYAEEDEYTEEDEDIPEDAKGGLIRMADGGSLDEPIDEMQNADGTITQMFDDGSSITYNQDGEVMKVSEAKRFEDGGGAYSDTDEEVQPWQNVGYNYGEEDDPTMTGDNSLYSASGPIRNTYTRSSPASVSDVVGDYDFAASPNIQYFDDGSSIETFDDGSTITYDSDGNVFNSTDAYETTYDDEGNAIVTDGYGNIVSVYDPQGNVIPLGGGRVTGPTQITGGGGQGGVDITRDPTIKDRIAENKANKSSESAISDLLSGLNTYGGAGAAGAVLGALLGDTDLFSGGSGGGGNHIDMSGVGAINPRTTDFGIGPARFVGYDEYGTPEQMPELYGNELYQNLNAPGFNEVNPGDYARMDAEESGLDQFMQGDANDQAVADEEQGEGMADGGMPQGGLGQTAPQTYYTFGTAVDPLQNLRNPTPFQPQQSQMPPQAAQNAQQSPPQQALPQMGMAPSQPSIPQGVPPAGAGMKSGGLPAWSNVPITQGRLNFRQGAAVHGAGDGQSDDIPAMLADGEYVIDAETVAQIGNGSTKAGAQALDKFRENIRAHKRSAPVNKIPPKTKALTSYLKGAR